MKAMVGLATPLTAFAMRLLQGGALGGEVDDGVSPGSGARLATWLLASPAVRN